MNPMKAIFRLLAMIALLSSSMAMAAISAPTPTLSKGSFTQYYSFTTVANYSPTSSLDTIMLSGNKFQFSSMSFTLMSSTGQALTSPASLSTFTATKQGQNISAVFNDNRNANITLAANTTYLIRVTGIATQSNVKYSLLGNQMKPGTFVPAVPEPGTYAMLIAGFGLVGAVTRRRRKA